MTTININLLPEDLRPKGGSGGSGLPPRDVLVPIIGGAIIAGVIAAIPYFIQTYVLQPWEDDVQSQTDQVKKEIDKYNITLKSIKAMDSQRDQLHAQLATLETVAGAGTSWSDLLNELRSLTPSNLWFDSLKADPSKGQLSLSCEALDYSSVAYFNTNLAHSEHFENPQLGATTMSQGSNGVKLVKFTITVDMKKPKV